MQLDYTLQVLMNPCVRLPAVAFYFPSPLPQIRFIKEHHRNRQTGHTIIETHETYGIEEVVSM
jgi:hypothetical protein